MIKILTYWFWIIFLSISFKKKSFICKLSFNTILLSYLDFVWDLWMLCIVFYLSLRLKYVKYLFLSFYKYPRILVNIYEY